MSTKVYHVLEISKTYVHTFRSTRMLSFCFGVIRTFPSGEGGGGEGLLCTAQYLATKQPFVNIQKQNHSIGAITSKLLLSKNNNCFGSQTISNLRRRKKTSHMILNGARPIFNRLIR